MSVGALGLLAMCMQFNGNSQLKVVVAEDVHRIAVIRLKDHKKIFEQYLGPDAHPEEEENQQQIEDDYESHDISDASKLKDDESVDLNADKDFTNNLEANQTDKDQS